MTGDLRTTYATGEIRGDTLLISRLSRFSAVVYDFSRWQEHRRGGGESSGKGGARRARAHARRSTG